MPIKRKKRSEAGRQVTISDIARSLGVSAMTVSRVLNGHPSVSDETRERVQQKMKEMRYQPNRWARSLVTRRSQLIGLVVPDISHSFYAEITRGVQQAIEADGYNLILCNSGRSAETELRELNALVSSHVDGLLIASEQPEDEYAFFEELLERQVPFVLIDRFFRGLAATRLVTDDFEVGSLATQHLISLGHKRIGYLQGPALSPSRLREEGYYAAMRRAGLNARPEWIRNGRFSFEEGAAATRELLRSAKRVTAIFAGNDAAAFGAISACLEAGLRVPEDISVAGAGNVEGDLHPVPFLTTLDWERLQIGREAGRLLLEAIREPAEYGERHLVFPPRLIPRRSTGAAPE